jgi:hypothetical protein
MGMSGLIPGYKCTVVIHNTEFFLKIDSKYRNINYYSKRSRYNPYASKEVVLMEGQVNTLRESF